jgi:hypothetical protein
VRAPKTWPHSVCSVFVMTCFLCLGLEKGGGGVAWVIILIVFFVYILGLICVMYFVLFAFISNGVFIDDRTKHVR